MRVPQYRKRQKHTASHHASRSRYLLEQTDWCPIVHFKEVMLRHEEMLLKHFQRLAPGNAYATERVHASKEILRKIGKLA